MQPSNAKQSFIIRTLSGALVLSLGISGYLYFQSNKNGTAINSEALPKTGDEILTTITTTSPAEIPSNEFALKELFGISNPSDQVKNVVKIEGYETNTLTSHWFDKALKIGADDFYVKFYKTQLLDEKGQPYDSHATEVYVSAITYKKISGQWQAISKQSSFGTAGSWGDVPETKAEILQLSPSSISLMLDFDYIGQGYFTEGKKVFIFAKNNWNDAGFVKTGENNEGAGCDSEPVPAGEEVMGPCWKYTGKVSVVPESNSEFPPLLVTRSGTESKEHRVSIQPVKNVTYNFVAGKYIDPNEIN